MWTSEGKGPRQEAVGRTVVLGLGNPLMGDDGVGLVALARLGTEFSFSDDVELVDGGTWGLNLLPVIEGAERLLILDAISAGLPPASLVMLQGDEVPRRLSAKLSPHQIDMREILALAQLRGSLPIELVAIGIEPELVDVRDGLSPSVATQIDRVVALAVDRLDAWGVRITIGAGVA